jgi:hypothetical protein
MVGIAFNLLLIPLVLWLGVTLSPRNRAVALIGALAGMGSLLLWAAAFMFGWFHLEVVWIVLSAVWWFALAQLLRQRERRLAIVSAVVGLAATLDAVVTGTETALSLPFYVFALVGGWKLPLQVIWTVVVGALLLARGRL